MKRNMLNIIILALLIVNIALSAIMMITVLGTMKKTSNLIDGIASALSLEIADPQANIIQGGGGEVAIDAIAVYQIPEQMTISLAKGADGETHYCLVSVSLSMNTENEDYAKYGSTIEEKVDLIKSEIYSVIQSHSIEEAEGNPDMLREEILERIQAMYNSRFIYNVVFRDIMFS